MTARPGGLADRSASVLRVTSCWKMAPRPAIPVAMPTWRKVLLIPDAIPLREWCTTPIAVDASSGLISPTPAPASRNPGISVVQPEPGSTAVIASSPAPTRIKPAPSRRRTGTRTLRRPEIGATTKETSVTGKKRRPACSGP